jgi:hypothetical protein
MSPSTTRSDKCNIRFIDTVSNEDALYYQDVCRDELFLKRVKNTETAILKLLWEITAPHLSKLQLATMNTILEFPENTLWENVELIREQNITDTVLYHTTIVHTVRGRRNKNKNSSGGIKAKIKRHCLINEQFRLLLLKMYNIDNTNKYIKIISSLFNSYDDFLDWIYEPIDPLTNLSIVYTDEIKLSIIKELKDKITHITIFPNKLNRSNFPILKQYKYSDVNKVFDVYREEIQAAINKKE